VSGTDSPPSAAAAKSASGAEPVPGQVVPRWCAVLLLALGLFTLPWIAGMAVVLPTSARAAHYDLSWAGFDVALCLLLLRTGWSALRDRPSTGLSAAMAGSLLVVDAWFDVMTASTTVDILVAVGMAVCVELPLAVLCLWIAGHVQSELRLAGARRRPARRRTGQPR
jgi:hypothetical protein